MFFIWAHNQPQWSSLEHWLHLPRLAGHSLGLCFPTSEQWEAGLLLIFHGRLGGTHPQNCGALLAPPSWRWEELPAGSRRTQARSPQGQKVAACGLNGGGSVCLCVHVCVCVHLCCVHWALVHACMCSCVHTPSCTQARVPVCAGVLRSGTCELEIAEEANTFWLEKELHPGI